MAPLGVDPRAEAPDEVAAVVWKRKGESTSGEGADLKGNKEELGCWEEKEGLNGEGS